jgi:hypothetical protein
MLAAFPHFSPAEMLSVAFIAALLLVPSALVVAILDWIRRDRKPPEDN